VSVEAGAERLRELNGVRSQIDFKVFIMKLLKEEHRQIAHKILNMDSVNNTNHKNPPQEVSTAAERLKCRMQGVEKTVELAFKKSNIIYLNNFRAD
jgi:hypothetical protein